MTVADTHPASGMRGFSCMRGSQVPVSTLEWPSSACGAWALQKEPRLSDPRVISAHAAPWTGSLTRCAWSRR